MNVSVHDDLQWTGVQYKVFNGQPFQVLDPGASFAGASCSLVALTFQ